MRHLFTILSALSLLMCLAVAGVWVRSYFARDKLTWCVCENARDSAWVCRQVMVGRGGVSIRSYSFSKEGAIPMTYNGPDPTPAISFLFDDGVCVPGLRYEGTSPRYPTFPQ